MTKKKSNPTSETDFILFTETVQYWLRLFQLGDWDVYIKHEKLEVENGAARMAQCTFHTGTAKTATISLNTDWGHVYISVQEIRRIAFHEVCHVLFADIDNIVCQDELLPYQRNRQFDREIHGLINKLEKVILEREIVLTSL